MTNLFQLAHLISAAWAAAGELITATAILAALNTAANAIRWTYSAGVVSGRLLWPVIHWTVRLLRQIDWRYAMTVALEGTVAVAVAVWLAAKWSHRTLIAVSAQLGKAYAALVLHDCHAVAVAAVAPAVHPLAELAAELEQLTRKELQALTGCRRKVSKRELIAMAMA